MFYRSSEHFCHCELLCLKENTTLAREICAVKLCHDFAIISICWQQVSNRCPILPNSQNSEVLKLRGSLTLHHAWLDISRYFSYSEYLNYVPGSVK